MPRCQTLLQSPRSALGSGSSSRTRCALEQSPQSPASASHHRGGQTPNRSRMEGCVKRPKEAARLAAAKQQKQLQLQETRAAPPAAPSPTRCPQAALPHFQALKRDRERGAELMAGVGSTPIPHAPALAGAALSPPGPGTPFWPANPRPCGSHVCSRVSVPENKRRLQFNPI